MSGNLKEFEKFWEESGKSWLKYESISGLEYTCAEEAWKYALEWTLKQLDTRQGGIYYIREELNGAS